MPKLPVVTPRKLLKLFLKIGFSIHHQSGSHINLICVSKPHLHIVIPMHNRDMAPKTLKSILVQAEISVEDFIKCL